MSDIIDELESLLKAAKKVEGLVLEGVRFYPDQGDNPKNLDPRVKAFQAALSSAEDYLRYYRGESR